MAQPNAFVSFWNRNTYGSLTFDVARTHVLDDAFQSSADAALLVPDPDTNPFVDSPPSSARFSTSGIRLKVMRHIAVPIGPERLQNIHGREEKLRPVDIAAGVSFELDSATFHPKARIRILRTASIGAFPCPHVKIQRRVPIAKTGFSLRLSYFCPLSHLHRAFSSPARLILSVDDTDHYGMRLTQNGIEVAGNRLLDVAKGGVLMGSALITLPNSLDMSSSDLGSEILSPMSLKMGRTALKLKF